MTKIIVDKAVLEQAIDVLCMGLRFRETGLGRPPEQYNPPAIEALQAALEQPQVVEPVAWLLNGNFYEVQQCRLFSKNPGEVVPGQVPLYTSPQPPTEVPLLSIHELADITTPWSHIRSDYSIGIAQATEAAVRKKAGL